MTIARIDEQAQTLIVSGEGARPASAALIGPRARVGGRLTGGGKTWRAVLPLRVSRWGGAELPLPAGEYALEIDGVDVGGIEVPPTLLAGLRIEVRGAEVVIAPPVAPIYETTEGQRTLEQRYASQIGAGENAVFFESFYG